MDKDLFKDLQDRLLEFSVTEYEAFTDKVSHSALQFIFKKRLFVEL